MTADDEVASFLRIVLLARRAGCTVRGLAKLFGVSKSHMGRLVRDIDALPPDALSQLGQTEGDFPQFPAGAASQMGQNNRGEGRP